MDVVKAAQTQVLRGRILKLLGLFGTTGADADVLRACLKKWGVDVEITEIKDVCGYLAMKYLVKSDVKRSDVLKTSVEIFKITGLGIDVTEGTSAAEGLEL